MVTADAAGRLKADGRLITTGAREGSTGPAGAGTEFADDPPEASSGPGPGAGRF